MAAEPLAPARRWQWAAWLVLTVVLGLSLAAGAGAFGSGKRPSASLYQRTLQVAGQYRCPVCADESAAVSDTPAAIEIRDQIRGWLQKGWGQDRIRTAMVHDYGSSILEKPPTSGEGVLVWALPAVAAALALAGLAVAFARWRRAGANGLSLTPPGRVEAPPAGSPGEPAPVAAAPRGEAPVATAPVQGTLFDVKAPVPDGPRPGRAAEHPRPGRAQRRGAQRAVGVAGAALVLLAGALYLLDRTTAPRADGQPETGGVTGVTNELEEAASLAQKDPVSALVIYQEVLSSDPAQPVALTAAGWIYAQGSYVKEGLSMLGKAESADPSYDPAHLYRGLVLLEDHQPAAAVPELQWYLAHGPAAQEVKVARTALATARSRAGAQAGAPAQGGGAKNY